MIAAIAIAIAIAIAEDLPLFTSNSDDFRDMHDPGPCPARPSTRLVADHTSGPRTASIP